MPYARRRRLATRRPIASRPRRRTTYKKKRFARYRNAPAAIPRGLAARPFPPQLFKKLTYCWRGTLTQALADTPISQSFRGNSVYDPDLTGIGGQPRYFDTLCGNNDTTAPYRAFTVLGSKINVKIWPNSIAGATGHPGNGIVCVLPRANPITPPATIEEIFERSYAKVRPIAASNSRPPFSIKHFAKTKSLMGVKDVNSELALQGDYNGNPSNGWIWDVTICNTHNLASSLVTVDLVVVLTYYVCFKLLNDVADS